jgi:hypothetical protein
MPGLKLIEIPGDSALAQIAMAKKITAHSGSPEISIQFGSRLAKIASSPAPSVTPSPHDDT